MQLHVPGQYDHHIIIGCVLMPILEGNALLKIMRALIVHSAATAVSFLCSPREPNALTTRV